MPTAASTTMNRHTLAAAAATPRFAPGQLVAFHGVAGAVARSEDLLATRALEHAEIDAAAGTVVVRLCDHFEDRGSCNRGHKCRFAHRVRAAAKSQPEIHADERRFQTPNATAGVSASAYHAAPTAGLSAPEFSSQPDCGSVHSGAGSSGSDRSVVATSRGWRHAAYDAAPRSLA